MEGVSEQKGLVALEPSSWVITHLTWSRNASNSALAIARVIPLYSLGKGDLVRAEPVMS